MVVVVLAALLSVVSMTLTALQRSTSVTVDLVVGFLVAAVFLGLAVVAVLRAQAHHRRGQAERARRDGVDVLALGARVADAEEALGREHERLHELRATLVGITTSHRLLHGSRVDLPEDAKGRLVRMYDSELARLERLLAPVRHVEETVPLPLADVLEPLVSCLGVRGHAIGGGETAAWVVARHDDVAEIVHVLLENAVAHGGGAGIALTVDDDGDRVRVRVSDRGPGVPAALAERIFERGARSPRSHGDGLGLHIARRLATDAGGRLWLDRTVAGPGATFVLELPGHAPAPSSCLAHSA